MVIHLPWRTIKLNILFIDVIMLQVQNLVPCWISWQTGVVLCAYWLLWATSTPATCSCSNLAWQLTLHVTGSICTRKHTICISFKVLSIDTIYEWKLRFQNNYLVGPVLLIFKRKNSRLDQNLNLALQFYTLVSYPDGSSLGQARILFLLDPHYPPDQHYCHLFLMENTYVGTLIKRFYVTDT